MYTVIKRVELTLEVAVTLSHVPFHHIKLIMNTPSKIGKYRIVRLLGEGAMGTVYEGFDEDIQRQVAIKTLHPHLIVGDDSSEFLERFKREAQIAASCIHPNIVLVLEYGNFKGAPYIVMEYVRGKTLADLSKTTRRIPLKFAISLTIAILKALHIAHNKGIVHRDVKPANIMLTPEKQIKLADFGIARAEINNELTNIGAILGTPKYMPKEQLLGEKIDARSDLYSVAVIFAELLSKTAEDVRVPLKALHIDDPSLEKKLGANSQFPAMFVPVLERGLRNAPANRFQTAKEFAAVLQAVYKGSSPPVQPSPLPPLTNMKTLPASNFEATQFFDSYSNSLGMIDISDENLRCIESDLNTHIGDEARAMLRHELSTALSLSEVIQTVAKKIPKAKTRQQFIQRWSL